MYACPSRTSQSSTSTMPGWRISDVARASVKKRSTTDSLADSSGSSTLTAARRAMRWCCARKTCPIPPCPSRWSTVYPPTRLPTEIT